MRPSPAFGTLSAAQPAGTGSLITAALCALIAIDCAATLYFGVARYPFGILPAAGLLMVYSAALVKWPWLWLIAVPALVPVIDLTAITGDIYFTESDMMILATLAVGY